MPKDCTSRVKNHKEFEKNLEEIIKNRKSPSKVVKTKNKVKSDYGLGIKYYYK